MKKVIFFILLMWLVLGRVFGQDRIDWDQIKAAPGSNYIPRSDVSGNGVWAAINAILSGANSVYGTGSAGLIAEWLNDSTLTFDATGAYQLSVGTDAQRPTGAAGLIRYNTTYAVPRPEFYDADSWNPMTYGTGTAAQLAYWTSTGEIAARKYLAGASRTVTVDASGNGDYTDISDAITYANAQSPSATSPITVLVYPGTYYDTLTLSTSYVNLVGTARGSVILTTTATSTVSLLTVSVANASTFIENIVFQQSAASGGNTNQNIINITGSGYIYNCDIRALNLRRYILCSGTNAVVYGCSMSGHTGSSSFGGIEASAGTFVFNYIDGGTGRALNTVSGGSFVNNATIGASSMSGGTFYFMSFRYASPAAATVSGAATFYNCSFDGNTNNGTIVDISGNAIFSECNITNRYTGASSAGYALRITAACSPLFLNCRITHNDVDASAANYAIRNTSGASATPTMRNTNVAGHVDFTNITITGEMRRFHDGTGNDVSRATRLAFGTNAPAYTIDAGAVTNSGFRLPNVATASLPTGAAGVTLYRTDTTTISWYDGSAWQQAASRAWARSTFALAAAGYTGWSFAADSGTQSIASGNTATFTGGWGIVTAASATDVLTITADSSEVATQYDLTTVGNGIYSGNGTLTGTSTYASMNTDGSQSFYLGSFGATPGSGIYGAEGAGLWISESTTGLQNVKDQFWLENGYAAIYGNYEEVVELSAFRRVSGADTTSEALIAAGDARIRVYARGDVGNANNYIIASTSGQDRLTIDQDGNITMHATNALQLPSGTTAQRPTNAAGKIRWNTSTPGLEIADGSNWNAVTTGNTLYTGSGSFSGSRAIDFNSNDLTFNEVGYFEAYLDDGSSYMSFGPNNFDVYHDDGTGRNSELTINKGWVSIVASNGTGSRMDIELDSISFRLQSGSNVDKFKVEADGDIIAIVYDDTKRDSAAHLMGIQESTGKLVPIAQVNAKYFEDSDLTLTAAEIYKFQEVRVFMSTTAGAASQTELTIPDAAAVYVNTKIVITSSDANGTYNNIVNTPGSTIYDAGSDASSIVVAPGETIVLWGIRTGASTYRWAVQKN